MVTLVACLTRRSICSNVLQLSHATQNFLQCVISISHHAAFPPMCCNYLTPRRISSNVLYLSHATQNFLQCIVSISRHAAFPPMCCIYLTPRSICSNVFVAPGLFVSQICASSRRDCSFTDKYSSSPTQ